MTSTALSKWADHSMFTAEKSSKKVKATLISGNPDPLGEIFSVNQMYLGLSVPDLGDVTNEQRRGVLRDLQRTVLKMPLEVISLHFLVEGVHRGITHQMVRQRVASFAQESMRFAVKEDLAEAIALPVSLRSTVSLEELVAADLEERRLAGLSNVPDGISGHAASEWRDEHYENVREAALAKGGAQAMRIRWDETAEAVSDGYRDLIEMGMPAEDARGIAPTNTLTKLHYKTDLRNFLSTMSNRVSDQAQFEWRELVVAMVKALRYFGKQQTYWRPQEPGDQYKAGHHGGGSRYGYIRESSEWQYVEITRAIFPPDFALGRRAFASSIDRPSRIGERVDAFAKCGVPSEEWTSGSIEHGIPPINPDEWLLDPESARLKSGEEFDIFGNRVPIGHGWHWKGGMIVRNLLGDEDRPQVMRWPRDFNTDEVGA